MGVARGRARGVSRREFLQRGLIGIGVLSLGAACAPTPRRLQLRRRRAHRLPPSQPCGLRHTRSRRRPQSPRLMPSQPTPAAQPTSAPAAAQAAPAAAKPKGSVTIVLESETDTILPKDGTTDNAIS